MGRPATQTQTPATGRVRGTRRAHPTRTVPTVSGPAAVHRPPTGLPEPVGELVRGHREGDDPPGHHRDRQRPDETPPRTRPLRTTSPRRPATRPGPRGSRRLTAHAGCL